MCPAKKIKNKFKVLRNEKMAINYRIRRDKGKEAERNTLYILNFIFIFNAYKINRLLNNKNYPKLTQEEIEKLTRSIIRGRNLNYKVTGNIQIILLANSTNPQ